MTEVTVPQGVAGCGCLALALLLVGIAGGFFGRIAWATLKAGWYLAEDLL